MNLRTIPGQDQAIVRAARFELVELFPVALVGKVDVANRPERHGYISKLSGTADVADGGLISLTLGRRTVQVVSGQLQGIKDFPYASLRDVSTGKAKE